VAVVGKTTIAQSNGSSQGFRAAQVVGRSSSAARRHCQNFTPTAPASIQTAGHKRLRMYGMARTMTCDLLSAGQYDRCRQGTTHM
jgi:hypothetical protein